MKTNTDKNRICSTSWRDTKLMAHLDDVKLKTIVNKLCGEKIFKNTANHTGIFAFDVIKENLQKSLKSYYTTINTGKIISEPLTYQDCVDKMVIELENDKQFYRRQNGYLDIVDSWAESQGKRKCTTDIEQEDRPRFLGIPINEEDFLKKQIKQCEGILSEGYIIAHLNTAGCCPECGIRGKIGWCESLKHSSNSFRDGICMNCHENNVITLFEIKTRWENSIAGKNTTYAGDYAALNVLFRMRANVYLVVSSRDTGIVRLGKITFAFMKVNERFLYAIQEKLKWGSPSTTVKCGDGLVEMKEKINPPMIQTLSEDICENIGKEALSRLEDSV